MREFKKLDRVFIKSNNTTNKIFNRYLYCLIPFILLILIYNFIWGEQIISISLIKSLGISIISCFVCNILFDVINKNDEKKRFLDDNVLTIAIVLGLFSVSSSILTIIVSSVLTIVIKRVMKNDSFSVSLYGILVILILNHYIGDIDTPLLNLSRLSYVGSFDNVLKSYGSIKDYFIGTINYLSPMLAILVFIYLFYKKSIKYNIVIAYLLTFSFIMFIVGMVNGMNIWYVFFQLMTGNVLFLSIFCLPDYPVSPIVTEGQLVYGIILGLISCILRFIVPELAIVISIIIGPLLITNKINKLSIKLK